MRGERSTGGIMGRETTCAKASVAKSCYFSRTCIFVAACVYVWSGIASVTVINKKDQINGILRKTTPPFCSVFQLLSPPMCSYVIPYVLPPADGNNISIFIQALHRHRCQHMLLHVNKIGLVPPSVQRHYTPSLSALCLHHCASFQSISNGGVQKKCITRMTGQILHLI